MATHFPRAGKIQPRGTKMIAARSLSHDSSAPGKPRANRFGRRKNLPNTGEIPRKNSRRNGYENGAILTTNHLLLPSHRRKAAVSLPITQPNCDFLEITCDNGGSPGRGGQPDAVVESPVSISSHGNFILNGPVDRRWCA